MQLFKRLFGASDYDPSMIDLTQYDRDCQNDYEAGHPIRPVAPIPGLLPIGRKSDWTPEEMTAMRHNREAAKAIYAHWDLMTRKRRTLG